MAVYAYALIPNHFHFLVKCKPVTPDILEKIKTENTKKSYAFLQGEVSYNDFIVGQFTRYFRSYAGAFNKENGRTGSLFQEGFKRITVQNREHFRFLLFYLHHNGIHHNLGKDFLDWIHTSYGYYLQQGNEVSNEVRGTFKVPRTSEDLLIKLYFDTVLDIFSNEIPYSLTKPSESSLNNFITFHEEQKEGLYPNLKKYKGSTFE